MKVKNYKKLKEEMQKVYEIRENSKDIIMKLATEFNKEIEKEQRLIKS